MRKGGNEGGVSGTTMERTRGETSSKGATLEGPTLTQLTRGDSVADGEGDLWTVRTTTEGQ